MVAPRKSDQYFRAGAAGLVRETGEPVAEVIGDPRVTDGARHDGDTRNGQRRAAADLDEGDQTRSRAAASTHLRTQDRDTHRPQTPGTRALDDRRPAGTRRPLANPQIYAWALVIVSIGIAVFPGARTRSTLLPVSISILLGGVIWRVSGSLLHAWRIRLQIELTSGSWYSRLRPGRGAEDAHRLVRASLLLTIAMSLFWLAWLRPGPRQYWIVIAVTAALAIRRPRWLDRHAAVLSRSVLVPSAHHLTRRIGVLSWMRRTRASVPAAVKVTTGLLVLLNIVATLALLDTAKLSFGLWAIHTKIAFVVMSVAGVLLLKSCPDASSPAKPLSSRIYLAPEPAGTQTADRSRYNGHAHGHRYAHNGFERPVVVRSASPAAANGHQPLRFRRLQMPGSRGKVRAWVAAGAGLIATGWIGYAHPGPLLIVAVLVVGATMLSMMEVDRHQAITMLLGVALGIAAVDYLSWRFSVTNWPGWWIAVPLLCAEALGAIHVLGFQVTVWPWPAPVVEASEDPAQHEVFMLIPTLNEGAAILRPTLEGCLAARQKYLAQHPNGKVTIVVCNDGRAGKYPHWAEVDMLAAELDVRCVTRISGHGAKAGNIENARQECQITGTALMAIFDADQVPKPDFLLKTILPFGDPKVGWVQTGQYYANLNNPVSRWADDQQSMFYNLLCPGKAASNAAFICGTNVVLRAAALDEIGGLPQDSVTEDFAASINLHPRWRSIYLTDVLATGLGPLDIPSYLKQQGRWALGTLAVFRDHWRDILLPKKNGLRFGQRVQYFLAGTHYLCGLRDLIYLVSPVLFIFTGVPAVRTATLNQYLLHFLPYGVLGIGGMWYSTRGVTGLRGVIIGFGSSPALIGSLVAVILHRNKPFAVTSKERQGRGSLRYMGTYVLGLLLCLAALAWVTQVKGRQETSLFISILWVVYSLLLLASFLWLACKDVRVRAAAQRPEHAEITVKHPYPSKLLMRKGGLRPVVNIGLAAVAASPLLLGARLASLPVFIKSATPFVITQQQVDARYVGVSLPLKSLRSESLTLEHDLGIDFSIIGRTQDITDQFDAAWADKLAAQGARPWVVLEFGSFGANGKPPLTASLPAIFNGVDDSEIARWAAEIRDYGKPVYLTVLLQVDKNWSVSSAVTNGGIPEDVPRAWIYIQSIFRAVGADNVAWVWAPADPVHDRRFAPPTSAIDVVLQDFIMYPGTRWGSPQRVLRNLVERYPGKPLFVEVSVSGPADEKAAWLARLGQAVDDCPQVYALLYHEGGPVLKPTPAQAMSWSEASDPKSLAAWKRIVTTLHTAGSHGNLRRTAGRPGPPGARSPPRRTLAGHPYPGPAGSGFRRHVAQHGLPG